MGVGVRDGSGRFHRTSTSVFVLQRNKPIQIPFAQATRQDTSSEQHSRICRLVAKKSAISFGRRCLVPQLPSIIFSGLRLRPHHEPKADRNAHARRALRSCGARTQTEAAHWHSTQTSAHPCQAQECELPAFGSDVRIAQSLACVLSMRPPCFHATFALHATSAVCRAYHAQRRLGPTSCRSWGAC